MKNLSELLAVKAKKAIFEACGQEDIEPEITQSTQPQFGHYQCNNALKLAKILGQNPRQIAEKIAASFDRSGISKIEIAGPGFINIFFDPSYLAHDVEKIVKDPHLGIDKTQPPQKIVVEFSSPNVAKELHVGHIRSTIIGDCLARLFEFLGNDVLRLSHLGDWGTQFGMLIAYMKDNKVKENADLSDLMGWYKLSKKRFDEDPDFKKRAQLEVVKLQAGDPGSLKDWKMICEISRKGFQEIYHLLDVKVIERGESFYNPFLKEIVEDLDKKGLITISNGAKCIFLEGYEIPIIIQKADGGYNYDTTDMAAIRHRVSCEKADRIIYVVDAGQSLHFQMLFAAAEKGGYVDPKKTKLEHVAFGVVLGQDGKKFKTRSGETEKLIDLITEAIDKSKQVLQERMPGITEAELNEYATILGTDAIKYADLSSHRVKDYMFSYEKMLRFEGNTAPFLLYAYVRINGIKKKVGKDVTQITSKIQLVHLTEIALALHLRQFGEALDAVSKELLPNRLTDYLYILAEKFHLFFHDCRVEGSPQEESRLLLCEATSRILKQGLSILGLKTLEKM